MNDPDTHIRAVALDAIKKISRQWDEQVPWHAIRTGFQADGERVLFANQARGIFKPQQMSAALSIKTTVPRTGRSRWYRDQYLDSANQDHDTDPLRYDLARGGLDDSTNRALLVAMQRDVPLIYFIGLAPAIYRPIFPVWIKEFKQEEGYVLLATADSMNIEPNSYDIIRDSIVVSYSQTMTRTRIHQAKFSFRIRTAYQWRCAFSGLPVRELLVGAHIIPDAEGGPPSIQNGICMSALHHLAFDRHLIGVDPDFQVHVSSQLHDQEDGDLLAAIKDLDGTQLRLPREQEDWPNRDFLEHRFESFRNSSP